MRERYRSAVHSVRLVTLGGSREYDLRELDLLRDRVKEPGPVRAKLLAGDRHDPADHFPKIERGRERLQDGRQKTIALFAKSSFLPIGTMEISQHQTSHCQGIPVAIRQLEHTHHRLLGPCDVAHTLPRIRPADRDEAERLAA